MNKSTTEDLPVSTSSTSNNGDGVALSTDLTGEALGSNAHEGEDVGTAGTARGLELTTALDCANVAAVFDAVGGGV